MPGWARSTSVCSAYTMRPKPREHAPPAVLGIGFAVARPVIGMETVRGIRINHDFDNLPRSFCFGGGGVDVFNLDRGVLSAVKPEQRAFQLRGHICGRAWLNGRGR